MLWLFDRGRFARFKYYAIGISLPVVAVAWQLYRGLFYSNWAAESVLFRQKLFFSHGHFLRLLPWRPLVLVEYQALWLVPLVLLAAWATARMIFKPKEKESPAEGPLSRRRVTRLAGRLFAVVHGGRGLRLEDDRLRLQLVQFSWQHGADAVPAAHVRFVAGAGRAGGWAVTIFVVVGAALIARAFVERCASLLCAAPGTVPPPTSRELLLDLTSLFLLGGNLVFFQQWDSYQLPFLPLVAIVLAKRYEGLLLARHLAVAGCCLVLLAGSAIWTREDLAKGDVQWILAERLRQEGIAPQNIASSWEWFAYWNFPEFVRQEGKRVGTEIPNFLGEDGWQGETARRPSTGSSTTRDRRPVRRKPGRSSARPTTSVSTPVAASGFTPYDEHRFLGNIRQSSSSRRLTQFSAQKSRSFVLQSLMPDGILTPVGCEQ